MNAIRPLAPRARKLALWVAIGADLLQIVLLPVFTGGATSPFDWALDLVVAVILVRSLGWHFALLPTFIAELVPALDLFPTWTAAVWFVTRTPGRDGGARQLGE